MDIVRKLFAWGGLSVAVLLVLAFIHPLYRQGEASLAGKTPRDFAFRLAGKQTHLSELRGKVVILNFWATWCPPCVEETPALNRLQQRLAGRDAVLLGISVDEDTGAYERFLRQQGVLFPTDRAPRQLATEYGTAAFPETYIIGRDGKIARKVIGPQQGDSPELVGYIDSLIGKN